MHIRFLILAGLIAAPAGIAIAQSPATHVALATPAGKSPITLYRPLARGGDCGGARAHRQTGKIPIAPLAEACTTQVARSGDGTYEVATLRPGGSAKSR